MGTVKKLDDLFEIKCKKCQSTDISVEFYAGFIYDCGGDCGSLTIKCNSCGQQCDGDDT